MKKNNLNIVKIDKNKVLFNYEKKVLIKKFSHHTIYGVVMNIDNFIAA